MENDDTFCITILKLIDKRKLHPLKDTLSMPKKLLHNVVREDDKSFHVLVVPQGLTKVLLHSVCDDLGHNGTARNNQCLK